MDNALESLKEMLEDEIKKVTKKNDITPAELDNMTKAVCLLEKIKMLEDDWEAEEYSNDYAYGRYGDRSGNQSYRRGRSSVTGQYVSRSGRSSSNRGGSYSYSGHSIKDRMIDRLESMADEAQTSHEHDMVMNWIDRLSSES